MIVIKLIANNSKIIEVKDKNVERVYKRFVRLIGLKYQIGQIGR